MTPQPTSDGIAPGTPPDEAVAALLRTHGGRLYALAKRFCGDEDEAADLVQETFLNAFRGWSSFKGESSPATWLYRIAARACQRMHRKRAGEPDSLAPLDESTVFSAPAIGDPRALSGDPAEASIHREAREQMETAIAALPQDFRMPLILKEIIGLPLADVARILDVKEPTVKTRLHRARMALRDAVAGAIPQRHLPPPAYERTVCLDLLQAKMEAMDRGEALSVGQDVVCERCRAVFATLDLAGDLCSQIAGGEIPPELRESILGRIPSL